MNPEGSTASIPVSLFNANVLGVTVGINSPPTSIWIGGTNADLGWQPQAVINTVTLDPSGPPAPNVLAIGKNSLAITPTGVITPNQTPLYISGEFMWSSVQLYIFFDSSETASWIILNQGQYVTGGPFP